MRITKESFWNWYRNQSLYRTVEDQEEERKQMQDTYTMPEAARLLGISRNQFYYIVSKDVFDTVQIGRYKCITKDSFYRWYENQSRYKLTGDLDTKERGE